MSISCLRKMAAVTGVGLKERSSALKTGRGFDLRCNNSFFTCPKKCFTRQTNKSVPTNALNASSAVLITKSGGTHHVGSSVSPFQFNGKGLEPSLRWDQDRDWDRRQDGTSLYNQSCHR